MKLDKLFDIHILTGVVLGLLIGLYYPAVSDFKPLLVILAVIMGLKVVGVLK